MKNKIKILFIILLTFIIVSNNYVFGYNIKYLGKYLDPTNSSADKSSIKSLEDYYADVYLYFCVKSYSGHSTTTGWVKSSSDTDTTKDFPNGNKVSYDNSYVNFTGLITYDGDDTLTSKYGGSSNVTDTWDNGQEKGTFTVGYDSANGSTGEVDIVYPGGEEGKVQLDGFAIVPQNGISASQIMGNFTASTIAIQADENTLDLGKASSIGSMSSPVAARGNKRIGFNISLAGGNYSLYKARRTKEGNLFYNESIETLSANAIKKIVQDYSKAYASEVKVEDSSDEEAVKIAIMEAISKDGIRFSRTCSATNPYADTRIVRNMDTAARAIYGMQAGVTWTSYNLGFKDGSAGYGDGTGKGRLNTSTVEKGMSVVNHYDNIIIIPFNPVKEGKYEIRIQYKKMEWDKEKKDYKEMEDASEFAGNDLVSIKNTVDNKYAKIEQEDIEEEESGEKFFEKSEVKGSEYKITAEKSFESDNKNWEIVLEECKWSIAETLTDAAKNLKNSSNVLEKNYFKYEFGKDEKKESEVMALRIVYKDEPEEEEEEEPEEFEKTLGPLKLKGTLQFINMTLTDDYSFSVSDNWAEKSIDEVLSASHASFDAVFNFYESTMNEKTTTSDYIASGEYLTPYMTDAYYYVVRALKWEVHDTPNEIQKKVQVSRTYDYVVIWGNKSSWGLSNPINASFHPNKDLVYERDFFWVYNETRFPLLWTATSSCKFIKDGQTKEGKLSEYEVAYDDAGREYKGAYTDHDHTNACCPGTQIENVTGSGPIITDSCGKVYQELKGYIYSYLHQTGIIYEFYYQIPQNDWKNLGIVRYLGSDPIYETKICQNYKTLSWPDSRVTCAKTAWLFHSTNEVDRGLCKPGNTITYPQGDTSKVAYDTFYYTNVCVCNRHNTYKSGSYTTRVYGSGTQKDVTKCPQPYYNGCYDKHIHTTSCFKIVKNGALVPIKSVGSDYYKSFVKGYTKTYGDGETPVENTEDNSNKNSYTGVNATNKFVMKTISKDKNYNFSYMLKYYEIINFKMYKISKMEFTDTSGHDEVFEDGNSFEVEPSEKYNQVFNNSENGIQKPARNLEIKFNSNKLNMSSPDIEDDIADSKYEGNNAKLHWGLDDKVYSYGYYEGTSKGYTDYFDGYADFEQCNVWLGDKTVDTKASTFVTLCTNSVDKMTCTEAALRVKVTVKITDVMNDYFKFVKDYEGSNENLAHNQKSLYFVSDDEKYSSSSQTSTTMLNRNDLWKGTIQYTYSMEDGFEINKIGMVKESGVDSQSKTKKAPKETLLGDKGFDEVSREQDGKNKDTSKGYSGKQGYFKDGYKPISELSKFIDATNFSGDEEEIYKAYKLDKENSYDSEPDKDKSEKEYVENLKYHVDMDDNKHLTDFYDWSWLALKVWADAHNGTRTFNSKIYYKIVDSNNLNFNLNNDKKYTNYTENGSLGTAVQDTSQKSEVITLRDESFIDQKANISDCVKINILSPVSISSAKIYTTDLINPTDISIESAGMVVTDNGGTIYLQKNAQFVIEFANEDEKNNAKVNFGNASSPDGVYTKKYIREYWVKLSFDCYYNEKWYPAGTYIRSDSIDAFVARTTENYGGQDDGIVKIDEENSIEIVAVAINMPFPDARISTANAYKFAGTDSAVEATRSILGAGQVDDIRNSVRSGSNLQGKFNFISTSSTDDAYHAAKKEFTAKGIIRIFGFEITDFKDIEYKNIFRKNANDEYANSGNYFAGRFEWAYSILDSNKGQNLIYHNSNEMVDRLSNPSQYGGGYVLPVGPKSQNNGYEYAPKLGYRFSFNVKTTGATTEKVTITPSYYYVSDKGDYKSDIDLYYKDSNGVYKKFENYNIYFKPNDGYRYLRFISGDSTSYENHLSSNLESKTISATFDLEKDKFSTTDYSGYVQVWYGEFKLPNSTVAIPKGSTNLNNPLTNGYIGVKFDISCTTTLGNTAEYSKDIYGTNTSQWDFEGNFGFADSGESIGTNAGKKATLNYKGFWDIDDETWQQVKSTVVLYDTDLRAEDDFQ